jgi:transposase
VQKYIGVDLHKKLIVACVINQAYQVLERRRFHCSDRDGLRAWFRGQGDFEVVVEASASYEWFVQLVEGYARRVVLAHPGKLRVIAESTRKSDKVDAHVLADFLARGMIPRAHRPTPRQREHRRRVRYRHHVQGRITSLKCRIRRILADYNADCQGLFTVEGRRYAAGLQLLTADRFVLDELWKSLDHYHERLLAAVQALWAFAQSDPPQDRRARRRLDTIQGVGTVTIDVFLAETADVRRFRSQKKLTAYAGPAVGRPGRQHRVAALDLGQFPQQVAWGIPQSAGFHPLGQGLPQHVRREADQGSKRGTQLVCAGIETVRGARSPALGLGFGEPGKRVSPFTSGR